MSARLLAATLCLAVSALPALSEGICEIIPAMRKGNAKTFVATMLEYSTMRKGDCTTKTKEGQRVRCARPFDRVGMLELFDTKDPLVMGALVTEKLLECGMVIRDIQEDSGGPYRTTDIKLGPPGRNPKNAFLNIVIDEESGRNPRLAVDVRWD